MLVLPFKKIDKERGAPAFGFSLCGFPKPVLWLSGFLGIIALSSTYHSLLYGYTMPSWSIPLAILSVFPFGYRIKVALSNDKTILYRQSSLFGMKVVENVWQSSCFDKLVIKATEAVEHQFYIIVTGMESDVSVHFCKMKRKNLLATQHKLMCMLGLQIHLDRQDGEANC